MENLKGKCVLLCVTGGIAAYKIPNVASALRKAGAEVHPERHSVHHPPDL